jgi:hypothetical protein
MNRFYARQAPHANDAALMARPSRRNLADPAVQV